jgi:hypothetical protein
MIAPLSDAACARSSRRDRRRRRPRRGGDGAHFCRFAGSGPAHHRGKQFQNNYVEFGQKGLGALLQWRIESARAGLPKAPQQETPHVEPDLAVVRANAAAGPAMVPAVTWIGHASTLVQVGGSNVLTDPIFSERASPTCHTSTPSSSRTTTTTISMRRA